ncbi:hypothetical protein CANMA_002578 [Candida margitis]|uniref:uncharacterized protein n=1 Tax=Candida margitis TaxID=1775924 RepID=UPI0022264BA8|nr:uncharacterized protein CANMA_002578 [Candida margitis]KAI5968076.1 hypothetical protein CANMA_002578 [Candida margitis]
MSITIREDDVYYQLEFMYGTVPELLAIPAPTMILDIKIYLNSHLLTVADDEELVRSIATRFQPFWNQCHYDTSISISDACPSTFSLLCRDPIFVSNSLTKISSIAIRLSVLSLEEIDLQKLLAAFSYLMASWFLNEEKKYPAVFSPVGRQFIKLNLFWYKKMRYEVLGTDVFDSGQVITDYIDVVRSHYTTLPLMSNAGNTFSGLRNHRGRNCIIKSYPLHLIDMSPPETV